MNSDDPKLTAYALGELKGEEKSEIEERVAASADAQAFVAETRAFTRLLEEELRVEQSVDDQVPFVEAPGRSFWWDPQWMSIRVAALAAVAALIAIVVVSSLRLKNVDRTRDLATAGVRPRPLKIDLRSLTPVEGEAADAASVSATLPNQSAGFSATEASPTSRLRITVDDKAYEAVRSHLLAGRRPPQNEVRIESMINHFDYSYPAPEGNEPFALTMETGICPWQPAHRLLRVGLKARKSATGLVAENLIVAVQFSSKRVASYRLLGGEGSPASARVLRDQTPGETLSSGQAVTALYEIVSTPAETESSPPELVTVVARFRRPGSEIIETVARSLTTYSQEPPSADLAFAATVAEFGLILRGEAGAGRLATVAAKAEEAQMLDPSGARAELVALTKKALSL